MPGATQFVQPSGHRKWYMGQIEHGCSTVVVMVVEVVARVVVAKVVVVVSDEVVVALLLTIEYAEDCVLVFVSVVTVLVVDLNVVVVGIVNSEREVDVNVEVVVSVCPPALMPLQDEQYSVVVDEVDVMVCVLTLCVVVVVPGSLSGLSDVEVGHPTTLW